MTNPDDVGVLHVPAAVEPSTGRLAQTAALILCLCALLLSFLGLFEWDVPLTRFVRSLNDVQIDHLSNPWLARLSDGGDRIGRGESLVILSLLVLAVGYGVKDAAWKAAGWQSLVAHGIAAIVSNLIKHLVGRPRPKFMHAGNLEFSPVTGSGWDSFPSGHATASFAVAAVFAARFPKLRWIILSLAAAVAASRVLRGSHFLTDATGGATVGFLVGTVAAAPWRDWKQSLVFGLFAVVTPISAMLVLLSVLGAAAVGGGWSMIAAPAGMAMVLAGATARLASVAKPAALKWWSQPFAGAVIAWGFGLMSGSVLTLAAVGCAGAALWLHSGASERATTPQPMREILVITMLLIGLAMAIELRGAWSVR